MTSGKTPLAVVPCDPDALARKLLRLGTRVLLLGAPGVGKSTLAGQLADHLCRQGGACACIGADPGSPAFGVPGALNLATRREHSWHLLGCEALCTLDAGRFRLPLVEALRRLLGLAASGALLIDAPGVVRGVAGAELLEAMVRVSQPHLVLMLARNPEAPPLPQELSALPAPVFITPAPAAARWPGKRTRARRRTRLWDRYLEAGASYSLALDETIILGTAPPHEAAASWVGRQVALLDARLATLALAEVTALNADRLALRGPRPSRLGRAILLIRDAQRLADGQLGSAPAQPADTRWLAPASEALCAARGQGAARARPSVRMRSGTATLVNGIFGDPLLHLRLRHQKRSLLFDLGESSRVAARLAHQVSDVFITHAHFDHIAGFMWLLRSRLGLAAPCRLYGPPGLSRHIAGLISGIRWDRIGARGPLFEITELDGDRLVRRRLMTGDAAPSAPSTGPARDGTLLEDSAFRVRAVTLQHGIPVLAFAFETPQTLNVRKDRLAGRGLPVGPWLSELKRAIAADQSEAAIRLPDGRNEAAGTLGADLLRVTQGEKLVYATDLADLPDNRERLAALARDADVMFCEAAFANRHVEQSLRTGHLTAQACGEIAAAANVKRLLPFHFSRRYQDDPMEVYAEVRAACACTVMPGLAMR